jgi:hypothetical protein
MPVAGRGDAVGARRAVSAGTVRVAGTESGFGVATAVTTCNGGRIDGQKSRSRNAGTRTRRLNEGVSRGRTVTTCGVGTWPRISIVS